MKPDRKTMLDESPFPCGCVDALDEINRLEGLVRKLCTSIGLHENFIKELVEGPLSERSSEGISTEGEK